jgi:hypothetical protein
VSLLDQQKLFQHFISTMPAGHSAYSFAYIFIWQDFFDFTFEVIDEQLCIFARDELGSFLYLPPLGTRLSHIAVDECFQRLTALNLGGGATRIENVLPAQRSFFDRPPYTLVPRSPEYLCRRLDIANLQGNPFKNRRAEYNFFVKHYPAEFLAYERSWQADCRKLYDLWAAERRAKENDPIYRAMLDQNRIVHERAIGHYEELGLMGRVVRIHGEIRAYTFGYPLSAEIFCVLLEVADIRYKGLPTYIFRRFCQDSAVASYPLINIMDDFGLPRVGETKHSFRPIRQLDSYLVTLSA